MILTDGERLSRITSYNVCYTKLLRPLGIAAGQRLEAAVGEQQQLQHYDEHRGGIDGNGLQHPAQGRQQEDGNHPLLQQGQMGNGQGIGGQQQDKQRADQG